MNGQMLGFIVSVSVLFPSASCNGPPKDRVPGFVAAPGSPLTSGPNLGPPEVADLNGDGHLDIVVPCARSGELKAGQLSVFLGDGAGRFRASHVPTGTLSGGLRLALGDVDNDGCPDAVLTRHDQYTVWVFLGDGAGALTRAPRLTVTALNGTTPHTHDVALADVNADGKLDVLTTNADDNAVAVLLGDGAGRFRPAPASPFPAGNHPYEGLAVADVNADGQADIVVPNLHGHTLTVLLGGGGGGFEHAPNSPFPVARRPGFTALGHIDRDPMLDVVATHDDDPIASIVLNPGKGAGHRTQNVTISLLEPAWAAVLADLDADGDDDLVLAGRGRRVMIHFNEGDGRFRTPPTTLHSEQPHPGYLTIADVNADDIPDLIIGHFRSDRFRGDRVDVLLGRR